MSFKVTLLPWRKNIVLLSILKVFMFKPVSTVMESELMLEITVCRGGGGDGVPARTGAREKAKATAQRNKGETIRFMEGGYVSAGNGFYNSFLNPFSDCRSNVACLRSSLLSL